MNKTNLIFLAVVLLLLIFSIYFAYFSETFAKKTIMIENHANTLFTLIPYRPFFYSSILNKIDDTSLQLRTFSKNFCSGIIVLNKNTKIEKVLLFHDMFTFFPDVLKTKNKTLTELTIYQLLQ